MPGKLSKMTDSLTETHRRSITVDFDDSFRKRLRGFLRQIVTNATFNYSVRISAREFPGIRASIRVWCTIGITFKGNGGHSDYRTCGKPLFQLVVLPVSRSKAQPPTIIMDHDVDLIRVV